MTIENNVDIKQSAEVIGQLFLDPNNRIHFHEGFNGSTLLKGEYPDKGSVTRLYFRQNGKDIKLQETIMANDFPDYFKAFIHHKHMDNNLEIWLQENEDGSTTFRYKMTYVRFSNFFIKIMSRFMKSKFQSQCDEWMMKIKHFCELSQHSS